MALPQVEIEGASASLFDAFEDLSVPALLKKAQKIGGDPFEDTPKFSQNQVGERRSCLARPAGHMGSAALHRGARSARAHCARPGRPTRFRALAAQAFVFIKPHAVTEAVKAHVRATLEQEGIAIVSEGAIDAKTISQHKLVDNHYYAIASKAAPPTAEW